MCDKASKMIIVKSRQWVCTGVHYKITSIAIFLKFYETKYREKNVDFLPDSGSKLIIRLCFPYYE